MIEHVMFVLFIVFGAISFASLLLGGIKEKDGLYCLVSIVPLALSLGAAYWYSLYLGTI